MSLDHHLLEKYWAGLCTPAERKAVEQWMSEGIPEESYKLRSPEPESIMKDQLWQRIAQARQEENEIQQSAKIVRMPIWFRGFAITAILILTIGLGIYVLNNQSPATPLLVYQELVLPLGKKASITLSDGTKVYLNAGSRLRYPKNFSKTERRIFLNGEAFFEVAKNPEKPFYVQTKQTTTRVLGTRFNIQSWKGYFDKLNVEEGRVQFTAAGCIDTLILHANMQGVFDGHSLVQSVVNSANKIAWTKGVMVFNDTKLSEVTAELERWYAVQIHLSDPELANYRLKARFDNNPSLIDVLQGISFALNIKYQIKDKEVTLSR
ncbi:hypothetical protein AY601_2782 [Pedobacter cryoconitis]|uniref:FecR family protein n=1 Tax=Pedobacter cryoconitis TaxID=188932 RepID=A0A127VED0_9SPHI|nr:FecR domain-containing protein [Pedobacter cryoconitis]AMP99665.1 hypothetical protein AY601_2782 [Pedobacter cryoconitis]